MELDARAMPQHFAGVMQQIILLDNVLMCSLIATAVAFAPQYTLLHARLSDGLLARRTYVLPLPFGQSSLGIPGRTSKSAISTASQKDGAIPGYVEIEI